MVVGGRPQKCIERRAQKVNVLSAVSQYVGRFVATARNITSPFRSDQPYSFQSLGLFWKMTAKQSLNCVSKSRASQTCALKFERQEVTKKLLRGRELI